MSCEHAHLDGSYVLGALAPGERREFEQHLGECDQCARSVRELAGLPGLLARVEPGILADPLGEHPLPETLLPTLLGEVRRTQRRRTITTAGLAAAAAMLVTVGVAVTIGMTDGDSTPDATPPATSAPTPDSQPMTAVKDTDLQAGLGFESVPWGTRLDLTCTYPAAGSRYEPPHAATYALVVRTRDGRTEQVATWRALPGRTMHLAAATSAARSDIVAVEVRAADGEPVLRLTT